MGRTLGLLLWLSFGACTEALPLPEAPESDYRRLPSETPSWLRWPTLVTSHVRSVAHLDVLCVLHEDGVTICIGEREPYHTSPAAYAARIFQSFQSFQRGERSVEGDVEELRFHSLGPGALVERYWPGEPMLFDEQGVAPVVRSSPCALVDGHDIACLGWDFWVPNPPFRLRLEQEATAITVSSELSSLTCCYGSCRNEGPHACALMADRTVQCWGHASAGQLGDGSRRPAEFSRSMPVTGLTNVVGLAAGTHHTCAVDGRGQVSCWGYNEDGQLGDGERFRVVSAVPQRVIGVQGAEQVFAGDSHSCSLGHGNAYCWGRFYARGCDNDDDYLPAALEVPGRQIVDLSLGRAYTCALDERGDLWCGGYL